MRLRTLALWSGALVPVLYFGVQAAALPFAPGYSVLRQTASELGMSTVSSFPALFNVGAMLRGVLLAVSSVATWSALHRGGLDRLGAAWVSLALGAIACNDFFAGVFPLPDERPEGVYLLGYVFWPPAVLISLRGWPDARALRTYVAVSYALTWALIVWRVAAGADFALAGLFQRLLGLTTVVPLGVAAVFLARRAGIQR